jgi:gliding motility-associated-like protein
MKKFRLIFFILSFSTLFAQMAHATHNRAGEIVIEQIDALRLRITVITYTKASSVGADREDQNVNFGDGSPIATAPRVNGPNRNGELIGNDIKRNLYVIEHTYPGRGTFQISMQDPNRNGGVLNVNPPNSDVIPFFLQTTYTFLNNNFQGVNNTPRLLQPPIDKGCKGKVFVHSLNAFDPDGDSIAYRLTVPLENKNKPVPRYTFPDRFGPGANNIITLDERTGQFTWRAPQVPGEYNIAFQIISYRLGIAIDTTIRDMQVLIENCDNDPPRIETIEKICVIAGQKIAFPVLATDPNSGQKIQLTALGGPFEVRVSPATFRTNRAFVNAPITDTFRWQTTCEHIENYPYQVVFKASDNAISDTTGLVDLKTVQIKVVGPPPTNVQVVGGTAATTVSWQKPYLCENAQNRYFFAFSVWRRENNNSFALDTCQPGLQGRGYTRIAFDTTFQVVNGRYVFLDRSVERGRTYCYRILAHFAKRTATGNPFNQVESLPSEEACVQLKRDLPIITKVSVEQTQTGTGQIQVKWTKPVANDLDTILNPGPYKFVVLRATGFTATGLQPIAGASFTNPFFANLNDTTWFDNDLNTVGNAYTYRIRFYYKGDSLLGESSAASSHFLTAAPTDRAVDLSWRKEVPWGNNQYNIFRKNSLGNFDSIGTTVATSFRDSNLVNGQTYCYRILALGTYGIVGIASPLQNFSQEICTQPTDNVPPCAPKLQASNNCDETGKTGQENIVNILKWTDPRKTCNSSADLARYKVFYSLNKNLPFTEILNRTQVGDTIFEHRNNDLNSVAGCYYVVAIDSVGNQSRPSDTLCLDNCPIYILPNVFTPNGDQQNDLFVPIGKRFIAKVEFKVFNRWGELVFETENPNLEWNGTNFKGQDLAISTYFYVCKVFEQRLGADLPAPKVIKGYIELFR